MIILLSPAKTLDETPLQRPVTMTQPRFKAEVSKLSKITKTLSKDDLKSLMHISDDLAELNAARFKRFSVSGTSNSAKPAILTFNGDVYGGLDAGSLSDAALAFAQDHIRILSGLYGLLRPLDALLPYRLEMGVSLENPRGKTLYDFWGDAIALQIMKDLKAIKGEFIVNLASQEYFKAVPKKVLSAPVIEPKFLDIQNGKARVLSFYAKRARGLMARWIAEQRPETQSDLQGFSAEGYTLNGPLSKPNAPVFTRAQPAPLSRQKAG